MILSLQASWPMFALSDTTGGAAGAGTDEKTTPAVMRQSQRFWRRKGSAKVLADKQHVSTHRQNTNEIRNNHHGRIPD